MDPTKLKDLQDHFENTRANTPEAQELYKQSEEIIKQFQTKFPIEKLQSLTLEEYVMGHQSKDSFCYWLEHTTMKVGKFMPGGSGYGYNVWFSQDRNSYVLLDGNEAKPVSIDEANERLNFIKSQLVAILQAADKSDLQTVRKISSATPLLQHTIAKVLSLYYPDRYLSLFSNRHMNEMLSTLGLTDPKAEEIDGFQKRETLLTFKKNDTTMKEWSNRKFIDFLYFEILKKQEVDKQPQNHKVNFWKLSPGAQASFWQDFKKENIIAMGSWGNLNLNLNQWKSKEDLLKGNQNLSNNAASQLWAFKTEVKPGDVIIAYGNKSIYDYGIVESDYQFDDQTNISWWSESEGNPELKGRQHWRKVRWLQVFQQQLDISGFKELYDNLKKTGTLHRIDDQKLVDELFNLSGDKAPLLLNYNEGLKTKEDLKTEVQIGDTNTYSLEDFIKETGFDKATIEKWVQILLRKKQIVFQGPPGTGKTFVATRLAQLMISGTKGITKTVQFHPDYSYEDFIQGYFPKPDGNTFQFSLKRGRFLEFCDSAKDQPANVPFVLIIDEVNRAKLSRVFGELMYLLEYREKEIPLAGGGNFKIPDNIYLIGTMNTADRSIALVDHALRRRFAFIRLQPDYEVLNRHLKELNLPAESLISALKQINQAIDDQNYAIGISFFMKDRDQLKHLLPVIWKTEIEPYLEEYFYDQPSKAAAFQWDNLSKDLLIEWL